jgi:hypothetical protein
LLPLTLKWAESLKLSLSDALARITSAPAEVLGLESGQLARGAVADICIFDPEANWQLTPEALKSRGKNSPWTGYMMTGKVRQRWSAGASFIRLEAGLPHEKRRVAARRFSSTLKRLALTLARLRQHAQQRHGIDFLWRPGQRRNPGCGMSKGATSPCFVNPIQRTIEYRCPEDTLCAWSGHAI